MPTEVIRLDQERDYRDAAERAASLLQAGQIVAFPTETVYGVGARADLPEAMARLRGIKERAEQKPFTLHIAEPDDLRDYLPDLSVLAKRFVRKAWPGPVTLVFPVSDPSASPAVQRFGSQLAIELYHEGTLGVRCPDDAVAVEVLRKAGGPVVAASANRAGNPPPRTAEGVLAELDGQLSMVLDGGTTRYARPSTVVRLDSAGYHVLREGVVDERTLKRFGSLNILFVCSGNTCRSPMAAALCRKLIAERLGCSVEELEAQGVRVMSAGANTSGGGPASPGAIEAMSKRGVNLGPHWARELDLETIHQADYIFVMTPAHAQAVASLAPHAAAKTKLLGGDEEITDPFGGPASAYESCADRIELALHQRLAEIHL
jgi:protein-tyrosine phosphatase